jgi:hypothetical protein
MKLPAHEERSIMLCYLAGGVLQFGIACEGWSSQGRRRLSYPLGFIT